MLRSIILTIFESEDSSPVLLNLLSRVFQRNENGD